MTHQKHVGQSLFMDRVEGGVRTHPPTLGFGVNFGSTEFVAFCRKLKSPPPPRPPGELTTQPNRHPGGGGSLS